LEAMESILEFSKEIFVWMKTESLSEYLVGGEGQGLVTLCII
jgi:hypothetical protein